MRRRSFIATTAGVGTAMLAGCSGGDGGTESGGESTGDGSDEGGDAGSGTFRLLISDRPAAIGDFDSLDVTLSTARVMRADDDERVTTAAATTTGNATTASATETAAEATAESSDETVAEPTADEPPGEDDEDDEDEEAPDDAGGVVTFDLDSVTVDLTQVVGDRAVSVLESELEAGRYSGIQLEVADATGVVDGDTVDVKVPSNRLRIVKPFEVGADEELSFVFDINVVKKGPRNGYNLLPVIGKSGVAGADVDVEEVEDEDEDDGDAGEQDDTNETDGTPDDEGPPADADN